MNRDGKAKESVLKTRSLKPDNILRKMSFSDVRSYLNNTDNVISGLLRDSTFHLWPVPQRALNGD